MKYNYCFYINLVKIHFFNSLKDSRLEIVFENDLKSSVRELNRIKKYLNKGV